MIIDQTSLEDLSIFHAEEAQSVFNSLNYTQTNGGRYWLGQLLNKPFKELEPILQTQQTLRLIIERLPQWPTLITNGTIMVMERFLDSQIDTIPNNPGMVSTWTYRVLHAPDYSLTRYSIEHCIDFFKGLQQTLDLFKEGEVPPIFGTVLNKIQALLSKGIARQMAAVTDKKKVKPWVKLQFAHFILYRYKQPLQELMELHGQLDAYYSLAMAVARKNLHFPSFHHDANPYIVAQSLYHLLLQKPVAYQLEMNHQSNFIFLTGANMAGKSTFIKSVGIAVYLAHLGMAVPAQSMELTLFDGLLSNINVADNIIKGESYFFNEVQRIKHTIQRINNGQKWLVLIDELFKGTNVQDAMRCSTAVIKGLLKIKNSLFILSTHLYEIGHELEAHNNMVFRYFETQVENDQLSFSYQLKEGISNDRLGYLILKREGVVDMLDSL